YEIAAQGDFEKVKAIIKSGAIINPSYDLKKKYGGNPLFAAVYNGHYNIISVLLNNGANVNARDVNGETPLDWAISRNDIKSDLMLRSGGGKSSKELDLSK
ncbi:MAG: ankyrin repeat domain-containing protein, partial [Verrucomicrobiota bacterium]|nr:ankyrin repeat domain-containing protein [Verrucomicrobiota bacterium]